MEFSRDLVSIHSAFTPCFRGFFRKSHLPGEPICPNLLQIKEIRIPMYGGFPEFLHLSSSLTRELLGLTLPKGITFQGRMLH